MINIGKSIKYYENNGFKHLNAISKVAQDIILYKIASTTLKNHITIKGGVVIYNITGNKRRATQDLDISLLKYSIDEKSIRTLFKKLSNVNDGVSIRITKINEILKKQEYKGKQVLLELTDSYGYIIDTKVDIGVQYDLDMEQEESVFYFEAFKGKITLLVNTKEQIFVEKLISLLRHKARSTRYKDIYDLYYFITATKLNKNIMDKSIKKYVFKGNLNIDSYENINDILKKIFSNGLFVKGVERPKEKWLDIDSNTAFETILEFIESFEKISV